jgi:hypothetical protein
LVLPNIWSALDEFDPFYIHAHACMYEASARVDSILSASCYFPEHHEFIKHPSAVEPSRQGG